MAAAGMRVAAAPPAPRLQLTFNADRTVTLHADQVTVREILAEWARLCDCLVVNADKLTGPPLAVPVAFDHAPQARVLGSLLRPAAGYVLTPQRPGSPSVSTYETIYIVAASHPVGGDTGYGLPAYAPVATAPVTRGSPDDEIPPVLPLPAPRAGSAPSNAPAPTPAPAAPSNRPGISVPPGVVMPIPIVPIGSTPPGPAPGQPTPAAPAPAANQPQPPAPPAGR
jgi:hypothetical protein